MEATPTQTGMRTSNQTEAIAFALSAAQKKIKTAVKDSTNPHFRSNYADLASIVEACRDALAENSLAVIQGARRDKIDGVWILTTRLEHKSGQWYESDFPLLARDQTAQAMGSAMTYAKRYSIGAMVGVVSKDEDDDGEGAMGRPANVARPQPAPVVQKNTFTGISDEQRKLAYAVTKQAGLDDDAIKAEWKRITGKDTSKDWTKEDYEKVMAAHKGAMK